MLDSIIGLIILDGTDESESVEEMLINDIWDFNITLSNYFSENPKLIELWDMIDDDLKIIITQCLSLNPKDRPKMQDLILNKRSNKPVSEKKYGNQLQDYHSMSREKFNNYKSDYKSDCKTKTVNYTEYKKITRREKNIEEMQNERIGMLKKFEEEEKRKEHERLYKINKERDDRLKREQNERTDSECIVPNYFRATDDCGQYQ